jgi:hypothetical protein
MHSARQCAVMTKHRPLGVNTSKAWIAGWDASLTHERCPYIRREFVRAWERGREAGRRATAADVAVLKRKLGTSASASSSGGE